MTQDTPQGTFSPIIVKAEIHPSPKKKVILKTSKKLESLQPSAGSLAKIGQRTFEADLQFDPEEERDAEGRWTLRCSGEKNGLVSIRFYICYKYDNIN